MALNAKSITIGLPVSDLEKSASWYEKLFMSDEKLTPVEGVIEYQIGSVWIQLLKKNKCFRKRFTLRGRGFRCGI